MTPGLITMKEHTLDAESAGAPGSALTGAVLAELRGVDREAGELDTRLQELERGHGTIVYAEAIHLLSHLRFEPLLAKDHWQRMWPIEPRSKSASDARRLRVAAVQLLHAGRPQAREPQDHRDPTCSRKLLHGVRRRADRLRNYLHLSECLAREY